MKPPTLGTLLDQLDNTPEEERRLGALALDGVLRNLYREGAIVGAEPTKGIHPRWIVSLDRERRVSLESRGLLVTVAPHVPSPTLGLRGRERSFDLRATGSVEGVESLLRSAATEFAAFWASQEYTLAYGRSEVSAALSRFTSRRLITARSEGSRDCRVWDVQGSRFKNGAAPLSATVELGGRTRLVCAKADGSPAVTFDVGPDLKAGLVNWLVAEFEKRGAIS